MDSVVKTPQKKLWLCGLLWWSLLLELVNGGMKATFSTFSQIKLTRDKRIPCCLQWQCVTTVTASFYWLTLETFFHSLWLTLTEETFSPRRLKATCRAITAV